MKNYEENWNELDEHINSIGQRILEDEQKPGILEPVWLQQMNFSYEVLRYIAEENEMTVSYELHKPFQSMGSICLEGEDLIFLNCKHLARAIAFADNVDIYPLTNGRVRLAITFRGLTKPMKMKKSGRKKVIPKTKFRCGGEHHLGGIN